MRIRFLRDFQGRATGEVFYRAGDEVDHANWAAICAEDAAAVVDPEPEPLPEVGLPPPPRRERRR